MARAVAAAAALLGPASCLAATGVADGDPFTAAAGLTPTVRLLVGLSLLSFVPAALIAMTSFTRIVVTLSFLRHALGMPETPPNVVLISLALFLTVFTMMPVWERIDQEAVTPYLSKQVNDRQALQRAMAPVREFMLAQTREKDIALILELARVEPPESAEQLSTFHIVPAFMLSELRRAFEIGFILFLPFVLIDIIVASVLMSLGMIMVPPLAFSLPLKVLMFVLIDGWALLTSALVRSFVIA